MNAVERAEKLREEITLLRKENTALKRQVQVYEAWRKEAIQSMQKYVEDCYGYDQPQKNILDNPVKASESARPRSKCSRAEEMCVAVGLSAKSVKEFQPTTFWDTKTPTDPPAVTKNAPEIPQPKPLPAIPDQPSQEIPRPKPEVPGQAIPEKTPTSPTRCLKQSRIPILSSRLNSLLRK